MSGDGGYINKFPDDAAEMARLVRKADEVTAVRLLQVWGSKQRDIGGIKAVQMISERIDAQEA